MKPIKNLAAEITDDTQWQAIILIVVSIVLITLYMGPTVAVSAVLGMRNRQPAGRGCPQPVRHAAVDLHREQTRSPAHSLTNCS